GWSPLSLCLHCHSFKPGIEAVSLVKDELEEQATPRGVILQVIVKFRRHRAELRQIAPWDRRQIMVLIVITHVQRHAIDRSVITEGLLVEIVSVMLLNQTRAHGMQPNRKEKREHKTKKPRPTAEINNRSIIRHPTSQIHKKPPVPHDDRF